MNVAPLSGPAPQPPKPGLRRIENALNVFDRIIVAQARLNGLSPLISSDEKIAEHYPRAVW